MGGPCRGAFAGGGQRVPGAGHRQAAGRVDGGGSAAAARDGALGATASQALGYKQLAAHFVGGCSEDEAYERIKIETRRFAKNQRTWLRRLQTTPGAVTLWPALCTPGRWRK
ncbi:hypothetical protein HC761_02530 [bacterium]|nr:hypothetical protein [bacterium]